MAEEGVKRPGIEEILFELLENYGAKGMDQGSLLVLLSLVNLMGIINIINYRIGPDKRAGAETPGLRPGADGAGARDAAARGKGETLDPLPLLSMLGGKGGSPAGPGQLASLLGGLMGSTGGTSRGQAPGESKGPAPSPDQGAGEAGAGEAGKTGGRP